jgi:hypothetical protein
LAEALEKPPEGGWVVLNQYRDPRRKRLGYPKEITPVGNAWATQKKSHWPDRLLKRLHA